MSKPHKPIDWRDLAWTATITVVALYALYVGLSALYTGQFFESGSRSRPSHVTLIAGAKAYFYGAFVASVGVTALVLLLDRFSPERLQFACLLVNAALFVAAVLFALAA